MITATIRTRKKVKNKDVDSKEIRVYTSSTKARKELKPIALEMELAKKSNRTPVEEIVGVSYDFDSEYKMLLEIRAIVNNDNEVPEEGR